MQVKSAALYQLCLYFGKKFSIEKPVYMDLEPGYYIYTGRSKRNLEKRIARHMKREKTIRWHIDQLSAHPLLGKMDFCIFDLPAELECELNQALEHQEGFLSFIRGFGNSDCRAGCIGHLAYFDKRFNWEQYCEKDIND